MEHYLPVDLASFNKWIDLATDLGKYNVYWGLILQIEDQCALEKQVAAAAKVQNHLSSVEASWKFSSLRRQNQEESVKPDINVFEDNFNLHMEKIYQKYPLNLKYNKDCPVSINPNCYFPLTVGAIQTWTKAMVSTNPHHNCEIQAYNIQMM